MLNDTYLMVIKIYYSRDTKQQSHGGVLTKSIVDSDPSVSLFLI